MKLTKRQKFFCVKTLVEQIFLNCEFHGIYFHGCQNLKFKGGKNEILHIKSLTLLFING